DVGLLNAKLEVAARQEEGDRAGAATGENDFRLQLLGQAELRDSLRDMLAAAAARIDDRPSPLPCLRVCLARADVGLWRAGAHRDAETGEHEGCRGAGHE